MEVGEIIYLSLRCHHQNDSCIKMGSDESHFNVSLILSDGVHSQLKSLCTAFILPSPRVPIHCGTFLYTYKGLHINVNKKKKKEKRHKVCSSSTITFSTRKETCSFSSAIKFSIYII